MVIDVAIHLIDKQLKSSAKQKAIRHDWHSLPFSLLAKYSAAFSNIEMSMISVKI